MINVARETTVERRKFISILFLAEQELNQVNTELAELLRGLELRKRAYYVNMPNTVYVIGRRKTTE